MGHYPGKVIDSSLHAYVFDTVIAAFSDAECIVSNNHRRICSTTDIETRYQVPKQWVRKQMCLTPDISEELLEQVDLDFVQLRTEIGDLAG
jgi:hypothetical protein